MSIKSVERKNKQGNKPRAATVVYLSVIASLLNGSSALSVVDTVVPNGRTIGMSRSSPTQCLRRSRSQLSRMTQLNYRHYDSKEEGVVAHAMRTQRNGSMDVGSSQPVWWNNFFSQRHDQQEVVDEYLEFLDKRYRRLNDNEESEAQFSAFAWLKKGAVISQERRRDALQILGVAELASQKLLQKHRVQKSYVESKTLRQEAAQRVSPSSHNVITVPSAVVERSPPIVSKAVTALSLTAQVISERRRELLQFQGRKLQSVVEVFVAMFKVIPSAVRRLWSIGGGKRSIGITLAAAAYLTLLLRPVCRAFVDA